jgi:hypothetical protein
MLLSKVTGKPLSFTTGGEESVIDRDSCPILKPEDCLVHSPLHSDHSVELNVTDPSAAFVHSDVAIQYFYVRLAAVTNREHNKADAANGIQKSPDANF